MAAGNLPPRTDREPTAEYFNNFFEKDYFTSQNVDDAVLGYFQTITGETTSARVLASTVLMTSLSQGIDPMSIIDELRRLSQKNRMNAPIQNNISGRVDRALFNSEFNSYTTILESLDEFDVGQLFYNPTSNAFYQKQQNTATQQVELTSVTGYRAEQVATVADAAVFDYFMVNPKSNQTSYTSRVTRTADEYAKPGPNSRGNFNEIDAYLTVFLNLNRVGSSLLGISNQPQTNKYVQRAILP
jgi:hypothetical protein